MSCLQVGKAIKDILAKEQITKVYPLVADEGTTFPFVIYKRTALTPASSKDRYNYSYMITMEVTIAASTYIDSVDLAEQIYTLLEHTRGTYNSIKINEINLIDASEEYLEDSFTQKLIFNIEIQ